MIWVPFGRNDTEFRNCRRPARVDIIVQHILVGFHVVELAVVHRYVSVARHLLYL